MWSTRSFNLNGVMVEHKYVSTLQNALNDLLLTAVVTGMTSIRAKYTLLRADLAELVKEF